VNMAQLMPLPLTVSCFSKIQIGFTILVPAHPVVPVKGRYHVLEGDVHWLHLATKIQQSLSSGDAPYVLSLCCYTTLCTAAGVVYEV